MRNGPGDEERGAAAVEFALVLVPLLLIVLGTIDWGYYFYVREVVTNAVREGARAGSLNPGTERSVTDTYLSGLNLRATTSQPCGSVPAGSVCVRVDYPTGSITGFLGVAPRGVMPQYASAQATMRKE